MDPLSITVSSIALAEVVIKGANELQELFGARENIQSLVDEVYQLERVVQDAQVVLLERKKHDQLSQSAVDTGTVILSQVQDRLQELGNLLNGCIKQGANGEHKLKLAYITWLQSKRKIKDLQQDLMDSRLALSTFWGAVQSPECFASIMGNLLVSFTGIRIWPRVCNDRRCRRQSEPRVEATYRFPTWLFQRMFYFAVSIRGSVGPGLTLQPLRMVAPSAPIFSYTVQGNLRKVQDLFSQGLASPYDVASNNGRTPLHYAAIYNHYNLTQFLLDTGCNPSVRDVDNESTVSLVWKRIFGNLFNEQHEIDAWRDMFDDEDHLESRVFPPLHKIVLGLSPSVALRGFLELDSSAIDGQDTDGYTALIWAAARGDESAVSVLLSFCANPNLANNRQQTALHMAAQGHDPRVIKIMRELIHSGAEADSVDFWRRTPLLYAAAEQDFDDPVFLEPLLETHQVNLDVQDIRDRTPLGYAALMGRPKTLRALLDARADPTIAANWGYTPGDRGHDC
ncbi:ankyrin [Fusarium sp. NRRL 52700]|nr:ankyrin [Fusarium sp. NRRL 52700]